MRKAAHALAALLALAAAPVWSARPLNTDDARILEPGGFQIESYLRDQRREGETEYWVLPAHNFGGAFDRMEWTLGGNVIRADRTSSANLIAVQVKTLLLPLPENGLGFAATIGVGRVKPGAGEDVPSPVGPVDTPTGMASTKVRYNPYFNLIGSLSLAGGDFTLHANGGMTRETEESRTQRTWGFASELFALARTYPIAEIYGVSGEKPAKQVGLRFWAIPDRWQIDGTYGWQCAEPVARRWISVGVRLLW